MEGLELEKLYKGKKVFVTGHTGFKGSWLCLSLLYLGADVCGYALEAPTKPALFELLGLERKIKSIRGDIRNYDTLLRAMKDYGPDIVIHLAAQPIVLESYNNPMYTYETNVMGTVHVLEAARHCDTVRSIVNVTTDKVYQNNEWCWGYRETDILNGYDPYSNSKSCSELVTSSYINSYFKAKNIPVSTLRAGNVIGGGDFSADRIIPDAYRSASNGEILMLRSPDSIRPYQHVLEAVFVYLYIAAMQIEKTSLAGSYNVGPEDENCVTTERLAQLFCESWGNANYDIAVNVVKPHEANFLKLDCSKLKNKIGWRQIYNIETSIKKTVDIYKKISNSESIDEMVNQQIEEYSRLFKKELGK